MTFCCNTPKTKKIVKCSLYLLASLYNSIGEEVNIFYLNYVSFEQYVTKELPTVFILFYITGKFYINTNEKLLQCNKFFGFLVIDMVHRWRIKAIISVLYWYTFTKNAVLL